MKKRGRNRFVAGVILMSAIALTVLLASSGVGARGSCNRNPCPLPDGCRFIGCDADGNCMYDCSGPLQSIPE